MATEQAPILVIGAGVVGLMLAQSLKKEGIPYRIFDRDQHIDARGHGWGITLWALDAVQSCLPASIYARIPTCQVDPESARLHKGNFKYLNLQTAEAIFQVTLVKQQRINRERFRKLILENINVEWNKTIDDFKVTENGVQATFKDGTTAEGRLLIGADGSTSKVRRILCPDTGDLSQLPIRFLGGTVKFTQEAIEPLREVDPMLFQGTHPENGSFFWYSLLDTPEVNGSQGTDDPHYRVQLNISWPLNGPEDEVPTENAARVAKLKSLCGGWDPLFRKAIMDISEDTEIIEIKLRDWPCLAWPRHGGKVTLIGDAAHAMTMYRGEAVNHGITDAMLLRDRLVAEYISGGKLTQDEALLDFESEMRERATWSVEKSRQACLDAHDFEKVNLDSALFARKTENTRGSVPQEYNTRAINAV